MRTVNIFYDVQSVVVKVYIVFLVAVCTDLCCDDQFVCAVVADVNISLYVHDDVIRAGIPHSHTPLGLEIFCLLAYIVVHFIGFGAPRRGYRKSAQGKQNS